MSSADTSTGAPLPPTVSSDELTRTFGVLLIGFVFSVVLYGFTFFQTYTYFTRFPSDNIGTKATVGALWALDTAITTLMSHTIYLFLITNFLTTFEQLVTTRTLITEQALAVLLVFLVQGFYAFRLWMVNERRIAVPAVIVALGLGACALHIAGVAQSAEQDFFVDMVTNRVRLLRGLGSALFCVIDITIISAMFFHMRPTRNPGMALPEDWYEQLVVYGFNRGTVFTVIQLLYLLVFLIRPNRQAWILLSWVSTKVYINSLLAMLNFRNTHRGRGVNEEDSLNQHASNRGTHSGLTGARDTARSVQFSVHPDRKNGDPIELDMVPSRLAEYDDDSGKAGAESVDSSSGGPSKRRDFDDESR